MFERRRWGKNETTLAAQVFDKAQGAIDVSRGLRMERNVGGAGFCEVLNHRINRFNHQVHCSHSELKNGRIILLCVAVHLLYHTVNILSNSMLSKGIAYHRTNGQVWHIVVVHYIEVYDVSTCR